MISFPSIKLNLFRKLEYFLVILDLNRKFNYQFKILLDQEKDIAGRYVGNFSTWEFEKKILFWTYAFHKHLGSPLYIKDFEEDSENNRLRDILLTENEAINSGIKETFENLIQKGLAEEKKNILEESNIKKNGILITEKGMAFGELIWNIYNPKIIASKKDKFLQSFGQYPRSKIKSDDLLSDGEKLKQVVDGRNKSICRLIKDKNNYLTIFLQLATYYSLLFFAFIFVSLEVLNIAGLLKKADSLSIFFDKQEGFFIFVFFAPVLLFIVSFIFWLVDFIFTKLRIWNKYNKVLESSNLL